MRNTRKSLIITLSLSSLLLGGCTPSNSTNKNTGTWQNSASSEMLVQLDEEGGQFKIENLGQTAIDNLSLTTYPPPLTSNILMMQYSFSKEIGTLEKGGTVIIKKDELKNDKGALLSNSKRVAGAIRISGKVNGQPKGLMFTFNDSKWILSPPDVKWSVTTEGELLGAVDEPLRGELNVELSSFGVKEAPYIINNKEAYPIYDLVITGFPLPKSGTALDAKLSFSKRVGTLEKGGTTTVSPDEMKNDNGELLSKSQVEIGVIKASGKVNGQDKENFASLSEKEK